MSSLPTLKAIVGSRRVALVFLLGFSSGLPFFLSGATLSAWMTNAHVKLSTIALFSWIGFAYTFKPLWAPLVDRYGLPLLGRRRGWLLLSQIGLVAAIARLGVVGPVLDGTTPSAAALLRVVGAAILVAFLSATQDIVIDAYRTDLLAPDERPFGAAAAVLGYRIGMLASGGGALILSSHVAWRTVYLVMAGLMLVGATTTIALAPEPTGTRPPRRLSEAVVEPLVEFFSRPRALTFLFLVMLLGFGDHLARTLMTPFLLKVGYTNAEVGEATKIFGVIVSILGTVGGSALIARFGLVRMMFVFGALQPLGAACYGLIALAGRSRALLLLAVSVDNGTTAMVAAAVDTLLMALCNKRYSATQFALLMSASSLAGRFVGGGAGWFADRFGWPPFFFGSVALALPALGLLAWRRREIERAYRGQLEAEAATA